MPNPAKQCDELETTSQEQSRDGTPSPATPRVSLHLPNIDILNEQQGFDDLQGEWSRLDLMRDPKFGQTAVRGFLAHLPARAHSIYFKDAIGNISTSQIRPGVQATEVILTPRYPLYGGWQAEFIVGYSLPLQVWPF